MAFILLPLLLSLAKPVAAQESHFVTYAITSRHPTVRGGYSVGGYSESRVLEFVSVDCGGPVGPMVLLGKPRKKGNYIVQRFKTTCHGGLADRYVTSMAGVTVRQQPDGRDLAEAMTLDARGRMVMIKDFR